MKKYLMLSCIMLAAHFAKAQQDYKVVFDLSSRDTINQRAILHELQVIRASSPTAKMEVVMYGHGIDLVIKDRSKMEQELRKLIDDPNNSFKVCAMTLKRNNIDKTQLLAGVEVVPDGIYEIITKQSQGWGYVKVGH
jgi:intracellular sulfur oxidation DsrE/DsrF family protein